MMSGSDAGVGAPARRSGPTLDLAKLILPADYPSHNAVTHADRPALIFRDFCWSFAALDRAADAMVTILHGYGIMQGDRIAYLGKNNDLFFIILFAAMRAGIVLVPANWRNTAPETRFLLQDAAPRLIIADTEFAPMLRDADRNALPVLLTDAAGPDGMRGRIANTPPAPRRTPDPLAQCLQLYTSGTTGTPKGVMSTQYAFGVQRQMELCCPAFDDWRDDEVLLSPLPNFHVGGMSWVLCGLMRGQTVVITADTAPSALLDLCLAHGITRTFIVPTLVRALIEEMQRRGTKVETLRGIHYGAAAMDPGLLERGLESLGCRFLQYYGMTEATGSITLLAPQDHDLRRPHLLRSVGQPLPGVTLEIRNAEGGRLEIGQPGEIWVQAPTLLIGYWNRPDAFAEVMHDGWYRTGDGGMLDENGYLFLTDRIKDMIVTGGENVYPAEVEAALRNHPAVQDCAVFGLPHVKWGEAVSASVELRPDHPATAAELIAHARTCLAAYKIPRHIEFTQALPRTASGKIQRGLVRMALLKAQENAEP